MSAASQQFAQHFKDMNFNQGGGDDGGSGGLMSGLNSFGRKTSNSERLGERLTYLTRALIKNNIVPQNGYLALITIEYFCMLYYVIRIVDNATFMKGFHGIEYFMDIQRDQSGVTWQEVTQQSLGLSENANNADIESQTKRAEGIMQDMQDLANIHVYINCALCGLYTLFVLLFVNRIFRITSYEQTTEQSYLLKSMSVFMVLSKTVLKIPVIASILIVIKGLAIGVISGKLFFVSLICNTVLALEFFSVVIYSLKFFNLEVPNEDIAWSYNITNGLYLKLTLKLALCSQELYREKIATSMSVDIICLSFILALEISILVYRMNTPNIFNTLVHDFTLLLESFVISITGIGLIALITQRDILSTMAYLCIFIPIIIKIFYTVDQSRKHYVLFKLKNEENLSANEYLIAITHLLKMIKRQSETDLAQLLSFTYYHKLYCYDQQCVCQFFTQFCQDPLKFKNKKQRTYRNYVDDGVRLVQQLQLLADGEQATIEKTDPQLPTQQMEDNNQGHSQFGILPLSPPQISVSNYESNPPLVGGQFQSQTQHAFDESNLDFAHQNDPSQIQLDFQQEKTMRATFNGGGAGTTAQNSLNKASQDDNENPMASQHTTANNYTGQAQEFKEKGISAQFTKGQILKGNAFNGFDGNLDFKIKGEFKSPAQFKSSRESRTYFFTRLLETLFKQLDQKTNRNTSFQLISIFFHFQYQHNVYLSAMNLVKLSKTLTRSTFQKMTFSVTEFYLLEMILNDFKHHTKDEIDYSAFIESSQMQQRLDWLYDDASQEIVQFWRLFKDENANVHRAYHLAMNISKNVSLIRDYTSILEERQLIKDPNKYFYYAMFYQNLLNDRIYYNQMINNLKNLALIRSIQKKNSRFGGQTQDINDIGFAIVSIEEGGIADKQVGKFIYCNKSACNILNVSEEGVIGKSANLIMPEMIRQRHDLFIKRFFTDGLNRLMGQVRNLYVRDFNGYIKPVQFFVNFYYTTKFNYSIIMHMDPITSVSYGLNSLINIKHAMIFLCSDQNIIQNMSENVRKIIGLSQKKVKEEEEIMGRQLKMDDVVNQFGTLDNNIMQNKLTYWPGVQVKVRNFKKYQLSAVQSVNPMTGSLTDNSVVSCSLTFEEITYLEDFAGKFRQRIYMIIPTAKIPEMVDSTNITSTSNMLASQMVQSTNDINNPDNIPGSQTGSSSMDPNATPSCSSIGSSSSGNSNSGIATTKNLLFQQKSPKILNLYLSIVFFVLISFMVIISVNFGIYLQKKNNVNLQIQYNQIINQRNIYMTSSMIDLKMMQLISQTTINKGNPNSSNIFDKPYDINRFGKYGALLDIDQDIFQSNHEQYKQLSQRYKQLTIREEGRLPEQVTYYSMSDRGTIYLQNNTLDFGVQMLLSNLAMIKPQYFLTENIPMNLTQYIATLPANKSTSPLFKNLYYIFTNGLGRLNYLTRLDNQLMLDQTTSNSSSNTLFINLISFISIGMITFIGISTFPMLGKIEDRKISVLKFFNLLSLEQIGKLIGKGEEFREEFQQSMNKGINEGYQEELEEDFDDSSEEEMPSHHKHGQTNQYITAGFDGEAGEETKQELQDVNPGIHTPGSKKNKQVTYLKGGEFSGTVISGKHNFKPHSSKRKRKGSTPGSSNHDGILKNRVKESGVSSLFKRIKEGKKGNKKASAYDQEGLEGAFNEKNVAASHHRNKQAKLGKKTSIVYKVEEQDVDGKGGKHIKKNYNINKGKNIDDLIKQRQDAIVEEEDDEDYYSEEEDDQGGSSSSDDDPKSGPKKIRKSGKHHKRGAKGRGAHHSDDPSSTANEISLSLQATRADHISEQLQKVALKEKVKLAFYVMIVLIFLNSCLIACFSIGQKTFQDDSKAMVALSTFYHRQNCMENLMLYTLEQFIQNKTILIEEGVQTDAVSFFISYCQQHEKDYNVLRRGLPVFLENSRSVMEGLESSNLCKTIFRTSDVQSINQCEQVYDQILQRGFTQTLYSVFTFIQTLNVRFQKEARSKEFLEKFIYEDQRFRDLTDMVKSYIEMAFQSIQASATTSALQYFDTLASYYIIIYGIYMGISIVMCLFFGLFVFKQLRMQIITSANILAIMPLEELDTRDRQKIESFLNS